MTDRKGLAGRLEAIVDLGWARGDDETIRQAAAALRQEPSVEAAFRRQTDNLAFILNRVDLPPAWFAKFDRELAEDRQAIASLYRGKP